MEFKVGDVVQVIKENLKYQSIEEYKEVKEFIEGYDGLFEVSYIYRHNDILIEIKKENGKYMTFFEKELEKVED